MANNQDDNEYDFTDLELSPDLLEEELTEKKETSFYEPEADSESRNNIIRNVSIVAGIMILILLGYRFLYEPSKPTDKGADIQPITKPVIPSVVSQEPTVTATPSMSIIENTSPSVSEEMKQKLNNLEENQNNLNSEINTIGSQLNTLDTNMKDLSNKINNLTQSLTNISMKLEAESSQINLLIAKQAKPILRKKIEKVYVPSLTYFIQAVIPGRAWLIASNGSTLTVREGTKINGYGIVKMIDPNQGRVLMSNGQVIRFSQQDS